MATTANYKWEKPDVGGSSGAWGTILNKLFDAVDAVVKGVEDLAKTMLPKAGGALSGRVDMKTASVATATPTKAGNELTMDLAVANYFVATIAGATTLRFTNVPQGAFATAVILRLTNGGSAAITWPAGVKWSRGAAPPLTAAGVDLVGFLTDDNGATWRGMLLARDVR